MSSFAGEDDVEDAPSKLFASLMRPKEVAVPKGPLIQDMSGEDDVIDLVPGEEADVSGSLKRVAHAAARVEDEGPTMMEQIMAAQAEAARAKRIEKEVAEKKAGKGFGGGFKAGFFGGSSSSKNNAVPVDAGGKKGEAIPTIRLNKAAVVAGKAASLSKVNAEVQQGMAADKTPLALELEKGDWMTPELLLQFQSNPIVARGLQNQRCKDALELMQKNPKEAQAKYANDKEVDAFLREFGKLMGSHFDGLAKKQEAEQQAAAGTAAGAGAAKAAGAAGGGGGAIGLNAVKTTAKKGTEKPAQPAAAMPGGPLYEQAMARQAATAPALSAAEKEAEEARVQAIINDPELSAMLMDPKMQAVLQDCGDPRKFQQIMRDPVLSKKIKKLFDSGLVSMAG